MTGLARTAGVAFGWLAVLGVIYVPGGQNAQGDTRSPTPTDSDQRVPAPATTAWWRGLHFVPRAAYWRASPSGTIEITRGGVKGSATEIDVARELGLGAANLGQAGIDVLLGNNRLGFSYQPNSFSGSAPTPETFVFHGATYPAGTRVSSDIDLSFWTLRYDYRLMETDIGEFRGGIQGYVWTFDAHLTDANPAGPDERRAFTHFLPAGVVSGECHLGAWSLLGNAGGGVLGSDRYAIDLQGGVGFRPWRPLLLSAEYRWLKSAFRETTNLGDLTLDGPIVSLSIDFDPS